MNHIEAPVLTGVEESLLRQLPVYAQKYLKKYYAGLTRHTRRLRDCGQSFGTG
ncbi:hypothetical protein MOC11_02220 [Bacillus haynesii]|uniref:hypothetical protein n=1 Tax=Bacillus haynesii TaxID=1925021 RepID=UPI002281BC98|nr:hypothetical protein [Bacillus haynesii]MCY8015560.1 hypothetical protein [Bacillus haynesii]